MQLGHLLRNIAIIAVVLGIAIFVIGRPRGERDGAIVSPPTRTTGEQAKPPRRIELQGPSTVSRRNAAGDRTWEANVKGGWRVDDAAGKIVGSDVSWRIVGQELAGLQVSAGEFEAEEQSDTVLFRDNVAATLPKQNAKFRARELRYDVRTRRLNAEGDVVLDWGRMHVTGQHLTADTAGRKIQVQGKVKMTYEQ